jgi:adenine phosphoribosyltransferase
MNNSLDPVAELLAAVRTVPDFPEPGIQFKDISPLLQDPRLLRLVVDELVRPVKDLNIDKVLGIESRGFILGPMIADRLGAGFVPVRKAGKLPAETISEAYDLEYGSAVVEMHTDALESDDRVLVHDDVIATGGTAAAAGRIVNRVGATIVGFSFLVELDFLQGRNQLDGLPVFSVLRL